MGDEELKDSVLYEKKIRNKIIKFILPITLENLLQTSTTLVTMAIIGRVSNSLVNAIGISSRIIQIIYAIFRGITTGASIFVAQAFGANDNKKVRKVIIQTLISCMILILILSTVLFIFSKPILGFLFKDATLETVLQGSYYIKIMCIAFPFWVIILVVGGVLQATGNAKTPMMVALIMNILNIVFSILFIKIFKLGIKGAALAILIAQFISSFIDIYILFNKKSGILSYYTKEDFKLDFSQILKIFKVGLPASMESILWQIAGIILTGAMLSFGEIPFAAYQLALQAEAISYMPAQGFGVAATAFIGQSLGKKDVPLGKLYFKQIKLGTTLVTIFTSLILLIFPKVIMMVLTNNNEVISLGSIYLILMGIVQLPQNLSMVYNGALRAAGYTKIPMLVSMVGLWGIRVPVSLILINVFKLNIVAIWAVICADLIVRFIISFIVYRKKDIYNKNLL